jgi:hypothetical protein
LRLTLGCLLAEPLGIQLRRLGSGPRLTFAAGEARLSAWMADNAYVTWVETDRTWLAEQRLIASVNLPLNLDQNRQHAFHQQLTQIRADARMAARTLPIVSTEQTDSIVVLSRGGSVLLRTVLGHSVGHSAGHDAARQGRIRWTTHST